MKRNKNTKTTVTLNYSSSLEKCTKWAYMINDQMQKPNKFQMQNQKNQSQCRPHSRMLRVQEKAENEKCCTFDATALQKYRIYEYISNCIQIRNTKQKNTKE